MAVLSAISACSSGDDGDIGDGGPVTVPLGLTLDEIDDPATFSVRAYYEDIVGTDPDVAACYAQGLAEEDVETVDELAAAEGDQALAARIAEVFEACGAG